MKVFLRLAAVASVVVSALAQGVPLVNTPASAVVCQPLLITWSGGTPPYFLSVHPGNQAGAAAIVDFGQVEGTQRTWLVNVPAGTALGINLRDSNGALSQSAPFTVQAGTDTACLNATSSSTTGSATGSRPPTTPLPTTSTPAPPTTRPTTAPTTTPTTPAASTPAASTPATSAPAATNAAGSVFAPVGMVAGLGAAVVALMV